LFIIKAIVNNLLQWSPKMAQVKLYPKKSRIELLKEFEAAPSTTLFSQETYCAVLGCSPGKAERDRWAGIGCTVC
jgi:hypothetical protein